MQRGRPVPDIGGSGCGSGGGSGSGSDDGSGGDPGGGLGEVAGALVVGGLRRALRSVPGQ